MFQKESVSMRLQLAGCFCTLQLQIPVLSLLVSSVGPCQVAGRDGQCFRLFPFIAEASAELKRNMFPYNGKSHEDAVHCIWLSQHLKCAGANYSIIIPVYSR